MQTTLSLVAATLALAMVPVTADGLLAHWAMEEIADGIMPDVTENGHDAKWAAKDDASPEFAPGIVGKALKLDAKDEGFLTVANSGDFNFKGPFTVMAWVKPTRRGAAFAIACMKGDKSGKPPWPGWRLRFFWARAMFQVGTPEGEEPAVSSPEWSVPAGFWSHVAATQDGEKLRVFVNAVEKGSKEFAGEIAPQHKWRPLILGNYMGRKNAYAFDGMVDDIKVFEGALSAEAIFGEATEGM